MGVVVIGLLAVSCGKEEKPIQPPPAKTAVETPRSPSTMTLEETEEEKLVYIYQGDQFRDPFRPAGFSSSYLPDAVFDPQKAVLKGIIYSGQFRGAVLRAGERGAYFVNRGRIFDIMGKTVKGFTAQVYENRVVLRAETGNTFELKIRSDEQSEEDKTL